MKAKIDIYGPHSILSGEYPLAEVKEATSYPVDGAEFSKAYKKKLWDGRKHLFRSTTGSFPTGLLSVVQDTLSSQGVEFEVEDHRAEPIITEDSSFTLKGKSFDYPYDFQLDVCKKMVKDKQGIVKLATNGGKTIIACAVTKFLGVKTLFLVNSRELLYQTKKRFDEALDTEVGLIGDGIWDPGDWVTVATVDTLDARFESEACRDFLSSVELLFIDEVHHAGSETWYNVCTLCPAFYRFGLSGTPLDRTDGANLRLIAATGDLIVDISNKFLVDRKISAKAHIIFDKVTSPTLKKRVQYNTAYKQGVVENDEMAEKVIEWVKVFRRVGLSTLILVEEIHHGKLLDEKLWTETGGEFIPHQFIHGTEDTETRRAALVDFEDRTLPVLIASSILDEGVDVPTIDCLICAGSRKSRIRTMQRLGRGLRGDKLIVVEFANFTHDYLLRHSMTRYQDYKKEECFPMHTSGPDEDLVRTIWNKE